ncbi:hypothetical protein Y032_0011g1358 [Ancylostoma ceylanicum]|nr:hypothetical protein Y032_0011g1358 [Ancylostoma ceylanicum]
MPRNVQTAVEFADDGKQWNIEQLRSSDATVRLQSGTNQFESQKIGLDVLCALIVVVLPRPRKTRDATAPLTTESLPQQRFWVVLIVVQHMLMLTNKKTN